MHFCISTLSMSAFSHDRAWVCTIGGICMTVCLSPCVHTCFILCMNIHHALSRCLCVCVCVALSVSPQSIGWGGGGLYKGRKRDNEWHWQATCCRASPRSRDTELIADSRCVSNCGGVGRPGYVSVSSVSACQEAKPPPEPPITASN